MTKTGVEGAHRLGEVLSTDPKLQRIYNEVIESRLVRLRKQHEKAEFEAMQAEHTVETRQQAGQLALAEIRAAQKCGPAPSNIRRAAGGAAARR